MIFVVGAGRSGTTLLARCIGRHPRVFKLNEKRYVWMYGGYWRSHDRREADEVTPRIESHIRQYFANQFSVSDCDFLVEKTPSNCLRIGFVQRIFPKARFVHIVRDGRAVSLSSTRAYVGKRIVSTENALAGERTPQQRLANLSLRYPNFVNRFRDLDLPPSGWPAYATVKGSELLQTLLSSRPPVWGVRYPGIHTDRRSYSPLVRAGLQWRESVTYCLDGLKQHVPQEQQLEVRYEGLVRQPLETLLHVFKFLNLQLEHQEVERIADAIKESSVDKWRKELNETQQQELREHIDPTLTQLGYLARANAHPNVENV